MKRLLYILTAALMASACGEEKNEVFYTISYPITEVGAEVTDTNDRARTRAHARRRG